MYSKPEGKYERCPRIKDPLRTVKTLNGPLGKLRLGIEPKPSGSWVSLLKMIVNEKGQQKQQEHGQQHPAIGMRVVVALCHCCGRGWQSSGGGFPS